MLRSTWSHPSHHDSLLQTIDGPVVLVGHSYGGAVITEAAAGLNKVKALVYVAAFALDKGEGAATVLPADKYPGSLLTPDKLVVRKYPDSSAQGGTNAGHSRRSDIKPLTGGTSYAEMMRSRWPDSSRREWTSSFRNTLRRW